MTPRIGVSFCLTSGVDSKKNELANEIFCTLSLKTQTFLHLTGFDVCSWNSSSCYVSAFWPFSCV